MPQENISGNIRGFDGSGLEGVVVQLISQDTGETIETIHSIKDGYWEFIRPATGKYNVLFDGRNTTDDDDIYGVEIVDMSEFEASEQFLNDTPPAGVFGDGSTPIAHVTNRLEAAAIVQWTYTPDATNKHQGFVIRYEHGPSSSQTITSTSPSLKIDSDARDFAIQIPADDYITIKVYAYFNGVSGTNEDTGYQHANWVDSRATALATLSGWESNPDSLSKNDALLHSDGYLVLGTGNDVVRLDATHATYREWIGHATDPTLAPYSVEKDGTLHATGAIIDGEITATSGKITGSLYVGDPTPNRILIDGAAKTIGSENFISGASGWRIDGIGDIEGNNITGRGRFAAETMLFQETAVTRGTHKILVSGGELFEAVTTTLTTFTIKIKTPPSGGSPFASGDICVLDNGTDIVWFTVGAPTDNTTNFSYTATQTNGSIATFSAGTAVADYGTSGDGGIIITADRSNAPYMDIFTHAGSPWTTTTTQLRAGKLDGISDSDFGGALSGFGLYSDNVYLKGNITLANGEFFTNISPSQRITINEGSNNALIFYDGSGEVVRIDDNVDSGRPGMKVLDGIVVLLDNGSSSNVTFTSDRGIIERASSISSDTQLFQVTFNTHDGDYSGLAGGAGPRAIQSVIFTDQVNTDTYNATAVYGLSSVGALSENKTAIGIYGSATNSGSGGAAYAGYFAAGDVYIADNLGIGTLSPSAILDIEKSDFATIHLNHTNGSGTRISDIIGQQAGTQIWRIGKLASTTDSFSIRAGSSSSDHVTVLSGGNVGIGTASPDHLLDIESSQANDTYTSMVIGASDSNYNGGQIFFRGAQTEIASIIGHFDQDVNGAGLDGAKLEFQAFNGSGLSTYMTIIQGGNVGIGTATPSHQLEITKDFRMGDGDAAPEFRMSSSGQANIVMTDKINASDEYFTLRTISGTDGGVYLTGITTSAARESFIIRGYNTTTNMTDTVPIIEFRAGIGDGGTSSADAAASETLYQFSNHDGAINHVTIMGNGDVGIGATPLESLYVSNASTSTIKAASTSDITDSAEISGNSSGGAASFKTAGVTGFQIRSYGDSYTTNRFGVGIAVPAGQAHIDQSSLTAAIPVLVLDQADLSEPMIEFVGTIGNTNTIRAIGSWSPSVSHLLKVELPGGLQRYIELNNIS